MSESMRKILTLALLALTTACSAQADEAGKGKKKNKGGKKKGRTEMAAVAGLTRTGSLTGVAESSGLALAEAPGTFYTHGDHGNRPELFRINWEGKLLETISVPGARNQDWEALAHDNKGRLYLADVGNNGNDRRDLTIYRFDPKKPTASAEAIRFHYADQTAFPPAKAARNFDCEAVIWRNGTLYLLTRDRGQHRNCRIYSLPDAPATNAVAKYVGAYELDGEISGADLSPDQRSLALIGREKLFLVALPNQTLTGGQVQTIALAGAGQTEGVVFVDDKTLAISTEQGAIYRYVIGGAK